MSQQGALDRRTVLAGIAVAAVARPMGARAAQVNDNKEKKPKGPGPICFFSKHLPKMAPGPMAKALKAVGYQGIELTVRPGGHVLPENVATDLPKALEAIKAEGLEVPIISTGFTSASDPTAKAVLTTAGKLGVRFFRPSWFKWEASDVRQDVKRAGRELAGLAALARRANIQMAYQNHVDRVGGAVWDILPAFDPLDPRWAGIYFDIRHAVAEGGAGSWKIALQLALPRTKIFSVKDFYWDRSPAGKWEMKNVPLGQGMCDLAPALALLAKSPFDGPISVYQEYQKPADSDETTVAAAGRDATFLRARLAEAYAHG